MKILTHFGIFIRIIILIIGGKKAHTQKINSLFENGCSRICLKLLEFVNLVSLRFIIH
jgi:hypothetical protein